LAENKKQHYVPGFYLKYFSNNGDGKSIGVWNLKAGKFIRYGSLENQAFENYFYGKDLEIEKMFADLEAQVSAILERAIKDRYLPKNPSEDYLNLILFILFQMNRTKYASELVNEMADKMFKTVYRHDKRVKDILDKVSIKSENPVLFALKVAANGFPLLFDLKCKLIINKTENSFIVSDNPVVRYNNFLLKRKWPLGKTGLLEPGLQIFYPIAPNRLLILYDDKIYYAGHNKKDVVYLDKKNDVDEINSFQYLGSSENLYFNECVTESYLRGLIESNIKYKHVEKANVTEIPEIKEAPNNNSSLIVVGSEEISKDVNLPFINITKYAKEYVLGPSAALVRNKQLLKYAEEFAKNKNGHVDK